MIIITGTFINTKTIWNNPISHRFISLLSDVIPFYKSAESELCYNAWTSNACHIHNFHRRDLKFSDIVPDTITIFKHNWKKNEKNLITAGTVPLNDQKMKNHPPSLNFFFTYNDTIFDLKIAKVVKQFWIIK